MVLSFVGFSFWPQIYEAFGLVEVVNCGGYGLIIRVFLDLGTAYASVSTSGLYYGRHCFISSF